MTRALHVLNALLALGLVGFSAWAWGSLPERIPAHFDGAGTPTRWADRSFWSWFGPALFGVGTAASVYAMAAAIPRRPGLINLPGKDRFLALPANRQAPVVALLQEMLYALTALTLVIFGLVQVSVYREAMGDSAKGLVITILVLSIALTPLLLVGWLPRIQGELNRQAQLDEGRP